MKRGERKTGKGNERGKGSEISIGDKAVKGGKMQILLTPEDPGRTSYLT